MKNNNNNNKKILWFFVICTRCTVCYAGLLLLILSSSDKGGLRITEEFLKVKWKYIVHAFQWATHLDCPDFFLCTKACRQIWVWPGCAFINISARVPWKLFRSEPVPMWILCTVAILWRQVEKKRCYQWSEQTVSVPNEDEYVSLTNQHNLEEANVFKSLCCAFIHQLSQNPPILIVNSVKQTCALIQSYLDCKFFLSSGHVAKFYSVHVHKLPHWRYLCCQ